MNLRERIIEDLQKHGPSLSKDVAHRLNHPAASVAATLSLLARTRKEKIYVVARTEFGATTTNTYAASPAVEAVAVEAPVVEAAAVEAPAEGSSGAEKSSDVEPNTYRGRLLRRLGREKKERDLRVKKVAEGEDRLSRLRAEMDVTVAVLDRDRVELLVHQGVIDILEKELERLGG